MGGYMSYGGGSGYDPFPDATANANQMGANSNYGYGGNAGDPLLNTSQSFNYSGGGQMGMNPGAQTGYNMAQSGAGLLGGGPLTLGLGLAGDLVNYLGSGDQRAFQQEKRNNARYAMGKMRSQIGTDVFNPNDTVWATHAANIPRYNALGAGLDKKYGFDSGVAGGQLANDQLSTEAQSYLTSYLRNKELSSQRDTNYLTSLAGGY